MEVKDMSSLSSREKLPTLIRTSSIPLGRL
uniref:Thymidylate kinase family protein n=1 Tax=Rhizophora mucronata TaxID=61149 RepID=A0A2P2J1E7_RHIMU